MKFLKEISLGTFNYGLGKFIPQLVGFFLIPVYTAFLTPNDYGIVESTMAIANFTMILMRLALPGSISRYYFDYGEGKELSDYITTLHRTLLAVSVIVGAACYFVLQESLHLIFPGLPFWPFIAIILVTTFLNTNSETQKRLLQARKMSRYSAILNIVTSLVGIVLALIFVTVFRWGALGIVMAGLCTAVVFYIQAQRYLRNDLQGEFNTSMLKPSFRYAMFTLPSHLVTPFSFIFGRSLLARAQSLTEVGLFSLANRFITPLTLLNSAFQLSYFPIYFELRSHNNADSYKKLSESCRVIWLVAVLIYAGVALIGPPLIKIITPARFHEAAVYLPYMAIPFLIGVLSILYGTEIYYSKKNYWVSIISILRFLCNLLIVFFFIDRWGTFSLIAALIAESIFTTGVSVYVSQRLFKWAGNFRFIVGSLPIVLIFLTMDFFLKKTFSADYVQALFGVVECCFVALLLIWIGNFNLSTLKTKLKQIVKR